MSNESSVPVLIYVTFPNSLEAQKIGKSLVEQKLAACVNILPQMTSIYEWEGKIQQDRETVLLIKTHRTLQDKVIDAVEAKHPYDVPAILAIDISAGNEDYFEWICAQTVSN